ncbi:MAG: tetratricopeptide repeat protein [Lysobacter sp.]|nr:tetratricopeptide repeat protein [Lysobacter sp.]
MNATVQPSREEVERHLAAGDLRRARELSEALLARAPGDGDLLAQHASVLVAGGDWRAAADLLAGPAARADAPFGLLARQALVLATLGDARAAIPSFRRALEARPDEFALRLGYAEALDAAGEADEAVVAYFRALSDAQQRGRWLNDATTPPGMRARVQHAMDRVVAGRQAFLMQVVTPHVDAFGRDAMARVLEAVDVYLGMRASPPRDPRQQPKFFWMPSLPATAFFDRVLFPWYDALESQAGAIRAELTARLGDGGEMEPFLGTRDAAATAPYLAGDAGSHAWDAYFFFRHGERFDAHHAACPRTSAALEQVPLTRIREHAPEVLFSLLSPRSHITPHHGVTNTRVVTHLPLIIPPGDCALVVGGETHRWQEGRCVTFDDSFLHEAWNRTGELRVVMILDCWNPYLEEAERIALKDIVERIGDFNAAAGLR